MSFQAFRRYVNCLCSTAELHGYAVNVYMQTKPDPHWRLTENSKRVPFWEGMAMAALLFTLRQLLGLNDSTER